MVDSETKIQSEEVKKHRNSDQSVNNSLILKTDSGLVENIEYFLPSFQIDLPFSYPTTEIFDIFEISASKKHFQVIEKNSTMATAVIKERYSIKNILLCCLAPEQRQKSIVSAVRMHITVNEATCRRTLHVKGIYGSPQVVFPLVTDFQSRIETSVKNKIVFESIENEEDTIITCKHESSSYYQFHKILSSERYTLGKSIALFVNAFAEQYRNAEESVHMLPLPLDSLKETVEQTVEALFTHYNYGRANTERTMVYCRPAVEKYIYSKVYSVLFPIYLAKTSASDLEISSKRLLARQLELPVLCEKIKLEKKFFLPDNYAEICEVFERLSEFKNPNEKVNCVCSVMNLVKAGIIDCSEGLVELKNEEDEAAVFVLILLKSNLQNPAAELEMMKDYVSNRKDIEKAAVLNLSNAVQSIIIDIDLINY